jgi:hypothetical protein
MVRFGVPGQNVDSLSYADSRLATVPVIHAPRRPTVNDKKFPMWCEWRTNKNATSPVDEGEFWKLIKFESNGDATWVRFLASGVSAGVVDIRDQVGTDVTVDAVSGKIDIDASIVANGTNPSGIPFETVADPGTHTLDLQMQLGAAVSPTPGDSNDAGLVSVTTNQFTIDGTSGMISLKGSGTLPPLLSVEVDSNTAPGTDPVLASGAGVITISGAAVAAHSVPIETHSRAVNELNLEIQLATAVSPTPANSNDAGLVSVNTNQFTIDGTSGMISLKGSTTLAPVLTIEGSDGGGALSPDASGNITIAGSGGATVTGAGNTITVNASAVSGGLTWREETGTSATYATDEGIFGNNAGTITLTLPTSPSVGDTFAAYQEGAGVVRIAQNASDQIRFGTCTSTVGVGGYIESLNQGDAVTLVALDSNSFRVISSVGSWTVT